MATAGTDFRPDEEFQAHIRDIDAQFAALAQHKVRLTKEAAAVHARIEAMKPQVAELRLSGQKLPPEWGTAHREAADIEAAMDAVPVQEAKLRELRRQAEQKGRKHLAPKFAQEVPRRVQETLTAVRAVLSAMASLGELSAAARRIFPPGQTKVPPDLAPPHLTAVLANYAAQLEHTLALDTRAANASPVLIRVRRLPAEGYRPLPTGHARSADVQSAATRLRLDHYRYGEVFGAPEADADLLVRVGLVEKLPPIKTPRPDPDVASDEEIERWRIEAGLDDRAWRAAHGCLYPWEENGKGGAE